MDSQNSKHKLAANDPAYGEFSPKFQKILINQTINNFKFSNIDNLIKNLLTKENALLIRNKLSKKSYEMLASRLQSHILPYFSGYAIDEIDFEKLNSFKNYLREFNLADVTIDQYFNALRKVFKLALTKNLITKIPEFPELKKESTPRGGFTAKEYLQILKHSKHLRTCKHSYIYEPTHRDTKGGIYSSNQNFPHEFVWLIGFMVNSFVRPVDIKLIQHKHVEVIRGRHIYLRLSLPETKKHKLQIVTLRPAVRIYERLFDYMSQKNLASPEDYLFLPEIKDREAASYLITKHFREILIDLNLRQGPLGQNRSLYSLRHTAITFRLLYGKGIDLLTLAKNARTSVEMIERFYASQLTPEMNIDLLQSRRSI
ncbi:phage integrase SAM-like domain-containing protein [Polynucleobacter sp. MWH-Spelu-300-X4]|uniref:phage integrase SAM-like domain-containing protein n=1 Tax=Polynucleobacter sp. MWH-Spelu-300-X4 TaxID=2689109 RepID=UPI001BFEAC7E|nr:phage integrase SAM-like domain-containing protein [Polynucleobacter sp. MWH-Spelu-300-X4]QWD79880.1 phage integrase SAM-like domain-containing protein [Polynucleobacter sp. MWH-Spelu-300-X4]